MAEVDAPGIGLWELFPYLTSGPFYVPWSASMGTVLSHTPSGTDGADGP